MKDPAVFTERLLSFSGWLSMAADAVDVLGSR
jgi:hypothetical protein